MLYLYGVLIGASVLALISDQRTNLDNGNPPKKDLFYFLTSALLICFVGLRTQMNDTASYIRAFSRLVPFEDIDWEIGSNPLFSIWQSFLKKYITLSPNAFIFLTSLFVVGVYVWFIKKHSVNFGYSTFLFIGLGVYGFTAAAMKQTISIAIALIAVDLFMRNKRIFALLLLVAAVLVHPYVIVYIAVPFLTAGVWDKRSVLILLGTFIVSVGFSFFLEKFIEITDSIGENYDATTIEDGTGVNILRVLVYLVIPVISFFARNEIRETNDKFLFLSVNLSLLTACFSILSHGGAGYALGRMCRYIDVFQCLTLPYIIKKCMKTNPNRQTILYVSIICFAVYYYFEYKKYLIFGFNTDYYNRISIFDLIKGWNG